MSSSKVTNNDAGKRLDLFLTLVNPEYSRTALRKLLDQGSVQVNGQVEYRPNYKVEEGDEVNVSPNPDMQRKQLQPYKMDLDIVYQNEDIAIVNKPSGLKVHPSSASDNDTLLNGMYYVLADELGEYGVNLVNRIDMETSGLVMLAITPRGAWHYAKQFADGEVHKEYLCIVGSKWKKQFGNEVHKVGNFLNYDWKKRIQTVDKQTGDYALTLFQMVKYNQDRGLTLLQAIPKTGRTHQIRIHLAHMNYPILGDKKYGGAEHSRLMLHAYKLSFTSPTGEQIEVESEIPQEFSQLL